ncbi:MAG: peptide chain release factor N(5)-glutamine methyltransferase [Candidatus Komeilibacteria bacterium]
MPTIKQSLIIATKKLNNDQQSASLEAEILLAKVFHKTREYLLANPDQPLNCWQIFYYHRLINQRLKNIPIAYLTKTKEFYGYEFIVNKNTLIPRPESELFIDQLKNINPVGKVIADIGTGSGCLIITAALTIPNNEFIGVDVSSSALKIAHQNCNKHQVDIQFIHGDLLKPFTNKKVDIVLANLPYLNNNEMFEPSIQAEPQKALAGGFDGLIWYQKLLQQVATLPHSIQFLLIELNPQQEESLALLIHKYLPKARIKIIKDLQQQTRILKIYC